MAKTDYKQRMKQDQMQMGFDLDFDYDIVPILMTPGGTELLDMPKMVMPLNLARLGVGTSTGLTHSLYVCLNVFFHIRPGCALCAAVGRDKSLDAMLESDDKYQYLIPLNKLQRFLVDTQYDLNRRSWLGRTIDDNGYVAIAPDAYSPTMQRELLSYALTIDRNERIAAGRLGIAPRFQLISFEQLIAIDAIWSIQGYHPRPFEAIHIWKSVYEKGKSFEPPAVDTSKYSKKIPSPRYLYIDNNWDDDAGYSEMYSGARHLMADFVGATETGGCVQNIELGDGRVVMAVEKSDMFDVNEQGQSFF